MTNWSKLTDKETNWGGKYSRGRWVLGEQPTSSPEHAGNRLLLGDNDRIGGWIVTDRAPVVTDKNTNWSEV